jgi:hypothetical protein
VNAGLLLHNFTLEVVLWPVAAAGFVAHHVSCVADHVSRHMCHHASQPPGVELIMAASAVTKGVSDALMERFSLAFQVCVRPFM